MNDPLLPTTIRVTYLPKQPVTASFLNQLQQDLITVDSGKVNRTGDETRSGNTTFNDSTESTVFNTAVVFNNSVAAPVFTGNLDGAINVQSSNEMTLASGFAGGVLHMNYRGAQSAITDIRFESGMSDGVLVDIHASKLYGDGSNLTNLNFGQVSGNVPAPIVDNTSGGMTDRSSGGTWISQKNDNTVLLKESNALAVGSSFRAFVQSTNVGNTFVLGRLADSSMGLFMYHNASVADGTDGGVYLDTSGATRISGDLSVSGGITISGTAVANLFNGPGTGLTGTAGGLTAGGAPWSGITGVPYKTANNFNWIWNNPGGAPAYVWGGTDGINMNPYSPSNLSVAHASTANNATSATSAATVTATIAANAAATTQPITDSSTKVATTAWIMGLLSNITAAPIVSPASISSTIQITDPVSTTFSLSITNPTIISLFATYQWAISNLSLPTGFSAAISGSGTTATLTIFRASAWTNTKTGSLDVVAYNYFGASDIVHCSFSFVGTLCACESNCSCQCTCTCMTTCSLNF